MDSSPVVKESGLKMASENTFYTYDLSRPSLNYRQPLT